MSVGTKMISQVHKTLQTRGKSYGPIKLNHERIAALWSTLLQHPVTPVQVAMCMVSVKLARLIETPDHEDSVIDIAGYAACIRECQEG